MTTQKKLVFLFVSVPLLLPFFITIAYSSFRFVKLNVKPLSIQNEYSLEKIAKETIQVIKTEETFLPEVSAQEWTFNAYTKKETKKEKIQIVTTSAPAQPLLEETPSIKEIIRREEDPFLNDWRVKQQGGSIVLSTQKSNTQRILNVNLDEKENRYLNYADIQGTLEWPALDHTQFFAEVSFYDQIGENGLNDDLSTVLASQELREDSPFLLKLPAETSGHLIAKIYSNADTQKEKPLYIGTYPKNPLFVPKEGLRRLLISMVPTAQYLDQYQTVFLGKVVDEYLGESSELTQGIAGVRIWVAETQEEMESNEQGFFEIRGLRQRAPYHLIFEKEGFVTIQVPIQVLQKKNRQIFVLSPLSKFTQGYDLLLGERDPSRCVLFATILKEGVPLPRAIVTVMSVEKVFYERNLGFISVPDTTLFSTSDNGKFLLWNTSSGKHKLHIYLEGQLISTQRVMLTPGVVHYVTIDL